VKPGLLVNMSAGGTRRDPDQLGRLRRLLPPERIQTTHSSEAIGPALDTLHAAGVDTLVLVGGDGTVGGTLTQLLERWPTAELPTLVVAPGGTVNTIARSMGARGAPDALLERLLAGAPPRHESRRPLVEVRSAEGEMRCGMIFANGVAVRWLRMYYEESRMGVAGATSVVVRIAGSASLGGDLARRTFAPAAARVEVDGELLARTRFTVMAAASVAHIGLGFRPFPTAGSDPARFHFGITDARATRLALELPAYRMGVVPRRSCVQHHSARHVRLRFDEPQPWSLDADVFPPTREIDLRATSALRFLVP
jgi:diacylglycerol kinase family enzyme